MRSPDGCWAWQGATSACGYGMFRADGHYAAHRWAFTGADQSLRVWNSTTSAAMSAA